LNSRIIRGRNKKAPAVRAIATGLDGVNYEVDTHEAIVEAAAPSFLIRQKQTEDTPFIMSPLLDDLVYLTDSPAADEIIKGRYIPPPGIDLYACEFIEVLAMPASIRAKGPVIILLLLRSTALDGEHKKLERPVTNRPLVSNITRRQSLTRNCIPWTAYSVLFRLRLALYLLHGCR